MPFQGANETSRYKPQGDALGYVRHWAFSPSLLNPKLKSVYLMFKIKIGTLLIARPKVEKAIEVQVQK